MASIVILGCGYVGTRLARAAVAEGRVVRACGRSTGRMAPLAELGVQVKYLDAGVPKGFTAALTGMAGATVVYSIPPVTSLPPGQAMRAALQAAYGAGAGCFLYVSSAGLYGAQPDDDVWIDEDTPMAHDDPPMSNVRSDEDTILASGFATLRTVILRLAPVYGPGRGVRERLRKNEYRLLDEGQHAISRIHVDDVVRVVFAAEQHAPARSCYLVADDEPTTQLEYARWLSERMGLPMPPSRSMFQPGASRATHRNRRIRNDRLKRDLSLELRYPSFREGEAAIEAEAEATAAASRPAEP
ncbi:MAG TPA: NAD-dependent epimerase/dehydratase family protein [Kofleriaceae bacterium]|nr:NAD-dependent epimerase/dehydratase family protein [Kofleriaceae bacterium]